VAAGPTRMLTGQSKTRKKKSDEEFLVFQGRTVVGVKEREGGDRDEAFDRITPVRTETDGRDRPSAAAPPVGRE